MREMRVPGLERVNGGVVKGGEAVTQDPCPGAERKLHHDGAIFHPGQRDAVIEFADVAERSGCDKGERDRWKKRRIFTGENLLQGRKNT